MKWLAMYFYLNLFSKIFPAILSKYVSGYTIDPCTNLPLFQWIQFEHLTMAYTINILFNADSRNNPGTD